MTTVAPGEHATAAPPTSPADGAGRARGRRAGARRRCSTPAVSRSPGRGGAAGADAPAAPAARPALAGRGSAAAPVVL